VLGEAERQKLDLELAGAAPPPPAAPVAPPAPTPAPPTTTAPVAPPVHVDVRPPPRGPAMRRTAYALAGGGVLSGAAALTVYLAYRGKYQDWKAGGARLPFLMAGSAAYNEQLAANNRLAASLTAANHAILGLSIASGALVAAGTVLFLIDRHARQVGTPTLGWNDGVATVGWSATW
jgi:multidrug efflux pump subunit AcrA (membrane-fusion protein)